MSKIRYALGMLATGAMAGVATHAAASAIGGGGPPIFTFTPADGDVIADGTQPFTYNVTGGDFGSFYGGTIFSYHGDSQTNHLTSGTKDIFGFPLAHFNPQAFYTDALPTAGETFSQTDITTWTNTATTDPWYHVEFTVPELSITGPAGSTTYLGTIQIDANGNQELDQIRYTPLAVPEPEVWALMILGLGATGAALRGRRRALAAAA